MVIISQALGNEKAVVLGIDPASPVTNDILLDSYYLIPGVSGMVETITGSTWKKGFHDDGSDDPMVLNDYQMMELEHLDIFRHVFGFALVIKQGDDLQAWNPRAHGAGFEVVEFEFGLPLRVLIYRDANDSNPISVGRGDRNANGDGFYMIRGRRGIPGFRSVPTIRPLIHVLDLQDRIFSMYLSYAETRGEITKVLKIATHEGQPLDPDVHDAYWGRYNTTKIEKAIVLGSGDDFDYKVPPVNPYDPAGMLEFGDKILSRQSKLTLMHLTGDAGGQLKASESTYGSFYDAIRKEQVYLLPQLRPLLVSLGFTDQVRFNDPEEITSETRYNTIAAMRLALQGIVKGEDIVALINETLGLEGDNMLRVADEQDKQVNDDGDKRDGNDGNDDRD